MRIERKWFCVKKFTGDYVKHILLPSTAIRHSRVFLYWLIMSHTDFVSLAISNLKFQDWLIKNIKRRIIINVIWINKNGIYYCLFFSLTCHLWHNVTWYTHFTYTIGDFRKASHTSGRYPRILFFPLMNATLLGLFRRLLRDTIIYNWVIIYN